MKQLKVIDLYNHCKTTVKVLAKLGAIPSSWCRAHDIYRDYIRYGVAQASRIHHIDTTECYRSQKKMERCVVLSPENKKELIQELELIIQLLNQN